MLKTAQEQQAISVGLRRDLDAIDIHFALPALKGSKHWPVISDAAVDERFEDGSIVRDADLKTAKEEADDEIAGLKEDLEKAQAKIDELRDKLGYQVGCIDRLQEAIVGREVDVALDLLREIFPEHPFLSAAAEHMLAGIRGQGALAL